MVRIVNGQVVNSVAQKRRERTSEKITRDTFHIFLLWNPMEVDLKFSRAKGPLDIVAGFFWSVRPSRSAEIMKLADGLRGVHILHTFCIFCTFLHFDAF